MVVGAPQVAAVVCRMPPTGRLDQQLVRQSREPTVGWSQGQNTRALQSNGNYYASTAPRGDYLPLLSPLPISFYTCKNPLRVCHSSQHILSLSPAVRLISAALV